MKQKYNKTNTNLFNSFHSCSIAIFSSGLEIHIPYIKAHHSELLRHKLCIFQSSWRISFLGKVFTIILMASLPAHEPTEDVTV